MLSLLRLDPVPLLRRLRRIRVGGMRIASLSRKERYCWVKSIPDGVTLSVSLCSIRRFRGPAFDLHAGKYASPLAGRSPNRRAGNGRNLPEWQEIPTGNRDCIPQHTHLLRLTDWLPPRSGNCFRASHAKSSPESECSPRDRRRLSAGPVGGRQNIVDPVRDARRISGKATHV